ncbi:helix-turn-helix domain-containing protein [Brevundimonas subvibrioides]|uniref:Helix-turn-helix domain protein n=1 Tax=Brevundimonas subvibrioides (strain ATCC 15264 / DSM 4735 / LMG 14903 / NBRC 16000 / CB 81) TaxID=633149 RepID=D9QI67_BRESC|nr:helix-turn-helix transcriptional regulator [Brevundimonas subvibrioides]ADL01325.1 helix-turn-helix domain protein [Brevundimonas subvibrioides ATCC 15264]
MARSQAAEERQQLDVHVGRQLIAARTLMGLSQSDVGRLVGVTFQQVQKYERGTNRISASVLWTLAEKLNLPVTYFFEGLDEGTVRTPDFVFASLGKVGVEMADAFAKLSPKRQRLLLDLARSFASSDDSR